MNTKEFISPPERIRLKELRTLSASESCVPDAQCALLLIYDFKGTAEVWADGKKHSLSPGWFLLSRHHGVHTIGMGDYRSAAPRMGKARVRYPDILEQR